MAHKDMILFFNNSPHFGTICWENERIWNNST